jgi:multicomponent Na+:H+ antiporter subunit D
MIPIFSLAGVPPLSGFVGKLAIVQAALAAESYWLVAVALAVSLATLLSMGRFWEESFWKPEPPNAANPPLGAGLVTPLIWLAALTLGLTVLADPVFRLSHRAAVQLLDAGEYMTAVLGGG